MTLASTFAPALRLSVTQQRIGFAVGVFLMALGAGIYLWQRHQEGTLEPHIVAYDPEIDVDELPSGEIYGVVKVPFASVKSKTGRGGKATGFHAEYRLSDSTGHSPEDWTRTLGPIDLDPNGLKHYALLVMQVRNSPEEGGYLEPWKGERRSYGIQSPVTIELRWESNEVQREERRMRVHAGKPPGFWPQAEWIES